MKQNLKPYAYKQWELEGPLTAVGSWRSLRFFR